MTRLRIEKELEKLVNLALSGTLKKETIVKKESNLYAARAQVMNDLESDKRRLESLPAIEQIEVEAEWVRIGLMQYFGSEDRLLEMDFDEKQRLLHRLFDGSDEYGTPFGIYVEKKGKGVWEYFIYAHLFAGFRYVKGDDIDYGMPKRDWDEYFKNCRPNPGPRPKKRPDDDIYSGPKYEAWLEYISQGDDYKTYDRCLHLR